MTLSMRAAELARAALSLCYPAHCASCDASCDENSAFCDLCAVTLEPCAPACVRCALPLPSHITMTTMVCLTCLRHPPVFSRAQAPYQFGGALARAIRRMKWAKLPELSRPLGRLLATTPAMEAAQLIVPVPLHPRRLRAREFNQAALLALAAQPSHARVALNALDRIRDTPSQSALDAKERRANVRRAFVAAPREVRGRRILLIDDVLTTGATADACARALVDAGALDVSVLTVARAVP